MNDKERKVTIIDGLRIPVEINMSSYGKDVRLERSIKRMKERRNAYDLSKEFIYEMWSLLNPANGIFWLVWPAIFGICAIVLATVTDCVHATVGSMLITLIISIIFTIHVIRKRNKRMKEFM